MDKESTIKWVRGLLVSSKYPMSLRQLDNDYRTIIGEKIPYSKFGFKKLEDFLNSDPTLNVYSQNGETFAKAAIKAESAHIVEMKMKEKAPKKRPIKHVKFYSGPVVHSNWRPNYSAYSARPKRYATSSRPAAVAHNQFVDYRKPVVASKIVIPENSTYNKNVPPRLQKQHSVGSRLQMEKQDTSAFARRVIQDFNNTQAANTVDECSPGSSRRKTITKMMSEVNLDRDSGNSSPVSDITTFVMPPIIPPKIPEFVPIGDPKIDLKNLIEYHKLGEMEVNTTKMNAKRVKMFICQIKIGSLKYTSYPEEFKSESEAELYCYKEAFKDITNKYGRRKSLLLASDKDILHRIPKMLQKHTGGLWEWQIQMDYSDTYNEQLPEDWLKIIDSSPCIHVQKVVNNYTLRHCKPEEVLQKGSTWLKSMTLTDVSVPSNTVEFKEDGKLFAEVQFLLSANEIWCRQTGTEESDKFLEMNSQLEDYYSKHKDSLRAIIINQNGYYIAEYDDGWYRVRAIDVTDTHVSCFYIDFGDEIVLPKDKIYQLKREYAICQAQAFVCRLAGLEELYDASTESNTLRQTLLYKSVILEVASDCVVEDEKDDIIPVYMYNFDTGRSINEEMIHLLTIESASPSLFIDTITEVYVSHIAENGDIYVQIRTRGYQNLLHLLEELEAQVTSNPPTDILEPVNKQSSQNKIYFGKYNFDGHWYRIKIIDWSPKEDMAQIYYMDYGNTEVINIKDAALYPLDKLSDILSLYPPQAVKTMMLLDEIPKDFLTIINKVMPKEEPVIVKIIRRNEKDTPLAEFFRRNSDGSLFCINKSITIENELKKGDIASIKSTRKIILSTEGSKNVPSGGKLKCPLLPDTNKYFEVHVPFAVNPYNFFVQPLESRPKLHKLMEQLQVRYKNVAYSPLTIDDIIPGNIYASKYDDGNWYRTSVIKVIHDGSISVFYCDFGYYANLTLQQLIPLDIEFMELPYQALKAKLSGIKPKHPNWTMEHCDEFKEMVERKHFYSILLKLERDQLYDSDLVLDLVLIDTSSSEDICIEKELINRGIAVEV